MTIQRVVRSIENQLREEQGCLRRVSGVWRKCLVLGELVVCGPIFLKIRRRGKKWCSCGPTKMKDRMNQNVIWIVLGKYRVYCCLEEFIKSFYERSKCYVRIWETK